MTETAEKSKAEMIEDLTTGEQRHRENAAEFRGQFLDLETSLVKFDDATRE